MRTSGGGELVDVWEILRTRLDYASFVPTPLADIERADLRRRDGGRYTVLKNPHGDAGAGRYLRLDAADVALFELMEGKRSVKEILVENLERSGSFALERLARLTAAMRANGFFGEEPPLLYEKLRALTAKRDPLTRLSVWLRRLVMWEITRWSNADGAVDRVYRTVGWLAFTRIGATIALGFGLYGLALWFQQTRSPDYQLLTLNDSYVLRLLALTLLQVLSDVTFLAAHFSDSLAQAADNTTLAVATDLAASTVDMTNAIIIGQGCHLAYNTVDRDGIQNVTRTTDWAQAAARKPATLIAGTGYQYGLGPEPGDTGDLIDFGERLYLELAKQLRRNTSNGNVSVGEALIEAKKAYRAAASQRGHARPHGRIYERKPSEATEASGLREQHRIRQ